MLRSYKGFIKFLTNVGELFSYWRQDLGGNIILSLIGVISFVVLLTISMVSLNDSIFEDFKAGNKTLTCLNLETGERYVIDSNNINTVEDLGLLTRSGNGCLLRDSF